MRSKGLLGFAFVALALGSLNAQGDTNTLDESALFRWRVTDGTFEPLTPSDTEPKNLYLRWDNRDQRYVWVTGDNRHRILSQSKVQGGRLGFTGKEARNWYLYTENDRKPWTKNTERVRPEMWRWDPARVVAGSFTTGIYKSERAPDDWETWGADLDPVVKPPPLDPPPPPVVVVPPPMTPPPVKPPPVDPPPSNDLGCTLTASPSSVAVGQTVLLTMKTTGRVISATLDGAAVDFPLVMRAKTVERPLNAALPAKIQIAGQVKGPNLGRAECSAEISVTAN